jgi:predicted transposase/invertase (TIGR01784 family)
LKTDPIFYQLFQTSPGVFFELIGTTPPPSGVYSFVSQEVKQTRFQIDGILLPHHRRPDLPIYFLEVQGYRQKDGENLYYSFFGEIFLYLNDYRPANDWRGVLIFTERRFDPGLPLHFQDYATSDRLQRVYLDEMPEDFENRSPEVGAIQLIGTTAAATPARARDLIAKVRTSVPDATARQAILELIHTIVIYKFPELSREEIESMLGLNELKQTRVYQEALEEGRQEGRQEGKLAAVPHMLALGATVEQVAEALGLNVEEVKQIAQQQASTH